MNEERLVRIDRMRYTKNSLSANLAILAIVLNALYFVSIYESDVGTYYYRILIGASVVYNLIFMLTAFLCSEGVKNYKKNYSYLLLALGAIQVARIFILPAEAHSTIVSDGTGDILVMGDGQYVALIVLLVLSSACLVGAAVTNMGKCKALAENENTLQEPAA